VRFLRSYVCNKLRRMSRRVSFDSPRWQQTNGRVLGQLDREERLRERPEAPKGKAAAAWQFRVPPLGESGAFGVFPFLAE
jgi:hypothetical protein